MPAAMSTKSAPSPSRFLLLWYILRSCLVTLSGEESSQPEDDQVSTTEPQTAGASPQPEDDILAKVNLPRKLPTLMEIKKAIPPQCFDKNTPLSIYYMIKDFLLVGLLYLLCEWTWAALPLSTQIVITPVFWLVQGTMFTALFVVGHDAGHGSFSDSELVNTICGNICHTFLFCPYYMWRVSHRHHHKNTGNIDKDEVFYPVRKSNDSGMPLLPGFGLGVGWFAYLVKGYMPRPVSHFNPLFPMFRNSVVNCTISIVCLSVWGMCLARFVEAFGWAALAYHYMVPVFIFATYTVVITFLHHTEDEIPWYSDHVWDYVRGQLSSVDRHYGWCHDIIHNIGTHQIHHLFSVIPHYHLEEATVAFRKAFPALVNIRQERILPAFVRMFRKYAKQVIIDDKADIHLYK